ncbi:MAG TPA: hypothetical protein P5110_06475 [Candidatus Omnitrophota bacterium]|nr:hypothetical protein [Candidatus Omnitrophota bacterium]HRZ15135.1 hypothetical protein [Candidatus Omnitrophota bacterium]
MSGFFSSRVARLIAAALDQGEWWAILFVVIGVILVLLIVAYPVFFMKLN